MHSQEEIEAIRKQLAEIRYQDGTPVFDVSIEPGMYGCYIKLANQDTVGNLYFRLLPAPTIDCPFCGDTHSIIG